MTDYFDTFPVHLQGNVDLDIREVDGRCKMLSVGQDDILVFQQSGSANRITREISQPHQQAKIALHPSCDRAYVAGKSNAIMEYSLTSTSEQLVYQCKGSIFNLKVSKSGRYISAASEEPKCILIDTLANKKTKCRPGHNSKVLNSFFSPNEDFIVSIGEDCSLMVYRLEEGLEPQEVFRTKIGCEVGVELSGCFLVWKGINTIFIPGMRNLQMVEEASGRWEIKRTAIAHSDPIIICEGLREGIVVTSCKTDLYIWEVKNNEKLIVLERFPMHKIIVLSDTFYGIRNDGIIYKYNRPLPVAEEAAMDVEEEQEKAEFQESKEVKPEEQEQESQAPQEEEVEIQYISSKKSKADKIITCYPQLPLTRSTEYFDNNRFLFINFYGAIVESRQTDDVITTLEYHNEETPKTICRNKQYKFFDMNHQHLVYANQTNFGMKVDKFNAWEKTWFDIQAVALGNQWIAVANDFQIKVVDFAANQVKALAFDRQIVAMQAYENLLVVVYHEGIPMWGCQNISMHIFSINSSNVVKISESHVPIQPQSTLRWFGFSQEGMLYSQDSNGFVRAYSLETNEWTSLIVNNFPDSKKMWIVGMKNYQIYYWRTTDTESYPTVRPRLNMKESTISIATMEGGTEQIELYASLLWDRFCLEHELSRWRIWGLHKKSREKQNPNYYLSQSIMNEKEISEKNAALDRKFFPLIEGYLKGGQSQKALMMTKSMITSIKVGKDFIQLFDDLNFRQLAIELEYFYEEKERQLQYEAILELNLQQLKEKAQRNIKLKKENPMNPKNRQPKSTLPQFNFSQSSQSSEMMQNPVQPDPSPNKQESFHNPFAKKKPSTTADRSQQIQQQVEKYGVKRKSDERREKKA